MNAGSRSGTYSLVPSSKVTDSLTLPMWPVHFTRPASGTNASLSTALGSGTQRALLSFVSSRFVLPEEEYWALQAYAGLDARAYMGACMASTISSFTIGSSNEYGSVFKSLVATGWSAESLNVTHLSTVYPVALLRGSYALPSAPSPMPPQAKPGATVAAQTAAQAARQQSKGSGSNSTLVLAIAIPVGIAVLAAALVGVISNRRLQRAVLAVRSESHSHKVMAADNDATSSSGTRLPRVGPGSDQAPGHKEVGVCGMHWLAVLQSLGNGFVVLVQVCSMPGYAHWAATVLNACTRIIPVLEP